MKKYVIFCWVVFTTLNCNLRFKPYAEKVDIEMLYACDTFNLWRENNLYCLDYRLCNSRGDYVLTFKGVQVQSIYMGRNIFTTNLDPDTLIKNIQNIELCGSYSH